MDFKFLEVNRNIFIYGWFFTIQTKDLRYFKEPLYSKSNIYIIFQLSINYIDHRFCYHFYDIFIKKCRELKELRYTRLLNDSKKCNFFFFFHFTFCLFAKFDKTFATGLQPITSAFLLEPNITTETLQELGLNLYSCLQVLP